jgi:DNA-directed RNA polymerase subunit M/transcription elongation factor TFIIS
LIRDIPGKPERTFLSVDGNGWIMNERRYLGIRKEKGIEDQIKEPDLRGLVDSETLIRSEMISSKKMHPSEIDLGKVICPRCGYRTSGYFLDQVTGSYNFFCSCCRHEWEC